MTMVTILSCDYHSYLTLYHKCIFETILLPYCCLSVLFLVPNLIIYAQMFYTNNSKVPIYSENYIKQIFRLIKHKPTNIDRVYYDKKYYYTVLLTLPT